MKRTPRYLLPALCVGLAWAPSAAAEAPPHEYKVTKPGFSASGMTQGEVNDAVSTFGGGLTLAATDLSLPGKPGLDVVITRVYNAKGSPIHAGDPLELLGSAGIDSPLGLGWRLMVAPELIDTGGEGATNPGPELLLPDGSSFYFYPPAGFEPHADQPVIFTSKGFWKLKYEPSFMAPKTLTVYSPTGLRYTYNWDIQPFQSGTGTGACCASRSVCGNPCAYDTTNNSFRWEKWCYGAGCAAAKFYAVMVPAKITNTDGDSITISYVNMGGPPLDPKDCTTQGQGFRGRIDSIIDSFQRKIQFTYNDDSQPHPQALSQITASFAGTPFRTITYNVGPGVTGFNQLNSVTQGALTTSYSYYDSKITQTNPDYDGLLYSVKAPSGAVVTYGWENHDFDVPGTGAKVTTPVVQSRTVTFKDGQPRVTTYIYPRYPQSSSAADEYHRTRIIDPEGNVTDSYHVGYDMMGSGAFKEADIGRLDTVRHYDNTMHLLQTEKVSYNTAFEISPAGTDSLFPQSVHTRVTQKQETFRGTEIPSNLISSSATTAFDNYGNPLTVVVTGANAATKTITYTYDYCNPPPPGTSTLPDCGDNYILYGMVKSKTVSGNPDYQETFVNDGRGHVKEHHIKDAQLGFTERVTSFDYYLSGAYNGLLYTITRQGDTQDPTRTITFENYLFGVPSKVHDGVGRIILQDVRADGLINWQKDRNDQMTSYDYTLEGLLKKITPPNPFAVQIIDYDWTVPKVTVTPDITKPTIKTTYTYDKLMELKGTEVVTGTGSIFTRTDYDRLGRAAKTYYPKLSAISDNDPRTETIYDGLGRPVTVTDIAEDARTTSYTYDAPTPEAPNTTRVHDAKQRTTKYDYDGFGRLHAVTDPTQHVTTYTYNHLDALTAVSQQGDGATLSRSFTYSPGGLLLSETHPESGTTSYTYNRHNEVRTRTQNGRTITMFYDLRGRQEKIVYNNDPNRVTTFAYDMIGSSKCTGTSNCNDQLVHVTDESGSTDYTKFDALGHLLSKSVTLTHGDDYTYGADYAYDTLGRLTNLTYPSGRQLTYTYDIASRLLTLQQKVGADVQPLISNMTYTAVSSPEKITYGSGVSDSWWVDKRFRPTRLTVFYKTAVPFWQLGYDKYDEMDNLKTLTVNGIANEETFDYDPLDRLTSAMLKGLPQGAGTMTGSLTYGYDPFGNRLTRTSNVSGIPNQDFAYANNQMKGFTYDANGNLVNDNQHTYAFTSDNKLRSVDGGAVTNYYNAGGERVITVYGDGHTVLSAYEGGSPVTTWELR